MSYRKIPLCHFEGLGFDGLRTAGCQKCIELGKAPCGAFDSEVAASLSRIVERSEIAQGEILFSQDEAATKVFVLVSGVVACSVYQHNGDRQILAFMFPGDFVGVAASETFTFAAEALTDIRVCVFSRAEFEQIMENQTALSMHLFKSVSNELLESQRHVIVLGRKNAESQLAAFLLMVLERQTSHDRIMVTEAGMPMRILPVGNQPLVSLPMRRSDIADYLGLSVETVSRTFSKLKEMGAISMGNPHDVRIPDLELLTEIAEN